MVSGLHSLWTDRCSVTVRQKSLDDSTGCTVFSENEICSDIPCRISFRLSFETVSGVKDASGATSVAQSVKLFCAPDVDIPPGSRITVTRGGRVFQFARSGAPAVYSAHQEVKLERFEGYA